MHKQLIDLADAKANKHIKEGVVEAFRATYTSQEQELLQVQRDFGLDSHESNIKEGVIEWSKHDYKLQLTDMETAVHHDDESEAALRYNLNLIALNRHNLLHL